MENKTILASIIANLKEQNSLPKRIDLSKIGDRYWCVVSDYDIDSISVINEDVTTGFSDEKEISVLKALSERAERKAFISGFQNLNPACLTERSDGFAAMPTSIEAKSVRQNALNEATERYVWSYWWDCHEVAFTTTEIAFDDQLIQSSVYLQEAFVRLDLEKVIVVSPHISNSENIVKILFAKIKGHGFVSGGASGNISQGQGTFFRAFDELLRHGFGYKQSLEKNIDAKSFYEKRLQFFASGVGNSILENRLKISGGKKIVLPMLQIDSEVQSPLQGFKVHRCYFENQLPFVGGDLERLCL